MGWVGIVVVITCHWDLPWESPGGPWGDFLRHSKQLKRNVPNDTPCSPWRRTEGPYPCILAGQGWAEEEGNLIARTEWKVGFPPHEMSSMLTMLPNCSWRVLFLDDSSHLVQRSRRKYRIDFLVHPFRSDSPLSHRNRAIINSIPSFYSAMAALQGKKGTAQPIA